MMRYSTLLFLLALAAVLSAQNINIDLQATLTYPSQNLSNIWGYASGSNEYALVGAKNGLSIVNVSNPGSPVEITQIPGPSSNWREVKTYQHYAYVVSEGGGGVQVVDLSGLPGNTPNYHSYFGDGAINGLLIKAHALHVDVTAGYLYVYGSYLSNNSNGGKALIFDLNADPYNPQYVGKFDSNFSGNSNYVHDGFVDNNIMYSAHVYGGFFSIVNTTNKSNPTLVTTQPTPGVFTHNTWRTGNTLFTTDEVSNSYLASYDISNTGNIVLLDKIQSNPGSNSIVHNTYTLNDYAITSWYKDGLTIVDVSRPANMVQVGNYDTYPNGSGSGFQGCWGVYPYLPSGNILASNINAEGTSNGTGELWILSPTYVRGCYLEGQITNIATGLPLSGAQVKILSTNVTETSAATGFYKMGQRQNGTYTVQVSKSGYVTYTTTVSLSNGVLTTLNVALSPVGLPVELVSFRARAEADDALLQWETATEVNNAGFEIEHHAGNNHWASEGFVAGKGAADQPAEYEFRVPDLPPGAHFFRLRQLDDDGKSALSEARAVMIGEKAFYAAFRPSVISDIGELYLFSEKPAEVYVEVFNAAGLPVGLSWEFDLENERVLQINAEVLPRGLYFAVVRTEQGGSVLSFLKI
ncbi:MAG: choice-of-anchor B family protein [Lewinellaceae bacterium]|nr:choice-of-anchor B family protein [Lewinellaceae bacterium]